MTEKETIKNWLNEIQQDLIANYDRLGLRASGKFEKSLEQFQNHSGRKVNFGISGINYSEYMQIGRRPNKKQDNDSLKKWVGWAGSTFLKKWVEQKGISINPFAVAWKIARKGIEVPNPHNTGGLITDVVTIERINELNKKLVLSAVNEFKSEIYGILNEKI